MAKIKYVRLFLLFLFSVAMISEAFADAEPTELDQFASYRSLSIQGHDVVLQDKARIPNGNWDTLLNSVMNNKERNKEHKAGRLNCSIPLQVLKDFSLNKYGVETGSPPDAEPLYCAQDKVWFASSAYCGEGDDSSNELGQAYLHSFDTHTGKVETYTNFIPRCVSISSLARIGNELWATTYFQGEYGTGGGSGILVLDLSTGTAKNAPLEVATHKFTDPSLSSIVYQEERGYVWVSTLSGIDRYSIENHKWEQRYFDTQITRDNRLQLTLSSDKPSKKKLWLGYELYFYPIDDLNGFASSWKNIELFNKQGMMKYDIPVVHSLLLPYYISALKNMDAQWNDYEFIGLLNVIAAHQDGSEKIKSLVAKLLSEPLSPERKNAVVQVANKYGVTDSQQLMDEQFATLMTDFFTNSGNGTSQRLDRMCKFAFKNPRYLSTLNDYYITHTISDANTERYFLDDCVRAYSMWQGYGALFPTVLKALNQNNDAQTLVSICAIFNHYANPEFRQARFIFPILNARLKTEKYVQKYKSESKYLTSCDQASYWIANNTENIDELMNDIEAHPELIPLAVDVLHELTGEGFHSTQEWRNWWQSNRKLFRPSKKKFYYDQ
jgi:hypothetical protein